MESLTAAEVVGRTLAALGVRDAFGVLGSGNFVATQALHAAGAAFHHARHEGGAICMADGYARVSGRVGVCSVHQGPGFTNAMTGLTEAAKAAPRCCCWPARRRPRRCARTSGSTRRRWPRPSARRPSACTPGRARRTMSRGRCGARRWSAGRSCSACRSTSRREPAPDCRRRAASAPALHAPAPSPAAVAEVAALIAAARRPVIIAGRGAVLAGAGEALEALGDAIGAVLATSAMGHGLFAGSPWAVGISGGFASPVAARLIAESDLVLAFGASLTRWTTRDGALIDAGAKVVQVDVDPDALGAHRPVDVAVVGDAAATARALLDAGVQDSGVRDDALAAEIAAGSWRDEPYEDAGADGRMDPRTLSIALDALLPPERTVAVDSGHFMGFPPMYLRVPDPAGFVFTQAFQSIGLGLASGIGAAIARPDRLTVACLGDGGALMALPELETLARLRLPMLVVVYNDAAYGAEVHHFRPQGHPVELVQFPDTDFAALAEAAGARGLTVRARGGPGRDRALAGRARRPARRRCEDHARLLRGMARGGLQMTQSLAEMLSAVDVVDLTQPLSEDTPVLQLPPPFANTPGLTRHEISRYDDRGPAWAWYWLEIGEHVGTHFDAPIHWVSGQDGEDVASVPPQRLVAPAVVIDKSEEAAADPDFCLTVDHIRAFEAEHGPLPEGGWLLLRTGWDARAHDEAAFLNANETGPHTPGFDVECARWIADESPLAGVGVETVGTDAGAAHSFDPPFPVHSFVLGAGKYGLTQLANLAQLPPTGAVVVVAPLKLVGGTGSPARVLALVPRG